MFLVWLPNQWDLDSRVDTDLTNQARIEADLTDLVDAGAFEPLCGPIAVPNHRAVPRLAFGLEVKPTAIVSASEEGVPRRGYFVAPASAFVIHNFILDPNDPTDFSPAVPAGFHQVAANESWQRLPPLLSALSFPRLDGRDRRVGRGGQIRVGEVDRRWQLDVEVVGGVEPGPQARRRARVEDVAAAARGRR